MKARTPFQLFLLGLFAPFMGAAYRERLQAEREYSLKTRAIAKAVAAEAKIFAQIIQSSWSHLGFYHRPGSEYDTPEKKVKKHKVIRVNFERIRFTEDLIWLKVQTRQRGMFGWKTALPMGVSVTDLCTDEMRVNLSHACRRHVSFKVDDYHRGFWVKVSRLETIDDLPVMVSYRDMAQWYPDDMSRLPVVLGVGNNREVHVVNIADFPHVLVAGSSGGGKSNVVNVIISSLIARVDPSDLKILLIDPKRLEFGFYSGIPHLLREPVLSIDEAVQELANIKAEIHRRTERLTGKYKKIEDWNAENKGDKIPRLMIIIDEYAVLRLIPSKRKSDYVEAMITEIGNLGRAVGIQMIICTQRPAAVVISNAIKINCQLVIAGRTRNMDQSRVILDDGDAAMLPKVPGRMIYDTGNERETIQVALITDNDVKACVDIAKSHAPAQIESDREFWTRIVDDAVRPTVYLLPPGPVAVPAPAAVVEPTPPVEIQKPKAPEPVVIEPMESSLERFVRECCVINPGAKSHTRTLYSAYKGFCAANGGEDMSSIEFGRALRRQVPNLQDAMFTVKGERAKGVIGVALNRPEPIRSSATDTHMEVAAK